MFVKKYVILQRKLVSDSLVPELLWNLPIFKVFEKLYVYSKKLFDNINDSILQMASIATGSSKVLERTSFNDTYEQNVFRWKEKRVLLVILGLHKVEFFFDPVNGFQNVDFKSWRNWSPTNTTTRRAWWLKKIILIIRCDIILLHV